MLSISFLDDSPPISTLSPNLSIIQQFLSLDNFQQGWLKVSAKGGSAGIDDETIENFKVNLTVNLTQLRDAVANQTYQFLPCKQVFIPKKKGEFRELKIPTIRDRIIQHALLTVLVPLFEPYFSSVSFAYRPNLSYINAVEKVAHWRDIGYRFVLDADVVKFFDNINHQRLLTEVKKLVNEPLILNLIQRWISVGVLTEKGIIRANKGIPQGAVISPLLANIYLNEFDHILAHSDLKLVRYADDFVVLANSQERIISAYYQVEQILADFQLELHQQKSQITNFDYGFRFLGHGFLQNAIFPLEDKPEKKGKKKSSIPKATKWEKEAEKIEDTNVDEFLVIDILPEINNSNLSDSNLSSAINHLDDNLIEDNVNHDLTDIYLEQNLINIQFDNDLVSDNVSENLTDIYLDNNSTNTYLVSQSTDNIFQNKLINNDLNSNLISNGLISTNDHSTISSLDENLINNNATPQVIRNYLTDSNLDENSTTQLKSAINQYWNQEMATLYLMEQGTTLAKNHLRFIIHLTTKKKFELPLNDVERILIFGNIHLTTPVMNSCLQNNVPLLFLNQFGHYKGHLWSGESIHLPSHLTQFEKRTNLSFQFRVSLAIVYGKLYNSKQLLLRLNRKRKIAEVKKAINGINDDLLSLERVNNIDSLRGYEGISAARYFPALGQLITNPDFSFCLRTRQPPKDAVNSLLSFGYTLLFNNVLSLIITEGLSPYLANFHYGEDKKPYLAFDLMEEFRSVIVDSLVIKMVNNSWLKPEDFEKVVSHGGVYISGEGKRLFLKHFEKRMNEAVSHPSQQSPVTYRQAIQLQIRRYKQSLLSNVPYEPFLRTG